MSKILRNETASPYNIADTGITIAAFPTTYTIPPQDYPLWAASSDTVTGVGAGDLTVNDGSFDLSISDGIDLIKGIFPNPVAVAGQLDDVSTVLATEGETKEVRITAYRAFHANLRDNSGNELGIVGNPVIVSATAILPGTGPTDLGKAEDAPHASGDTGIAIWGVRNDGLGTTFTSANGDYSPIATDSKGAVWANQSGTWILGANSGVDIGDVTINNAAGAAAVNIQDGGNSITVDGSVSVTGTVAVTQSTSPWVVSATDLDIRDLVFATDKVDVSGSSVTADTELPAALALADNASNPTAPAVGAFGMLWDGATWDRSPGNSTDGTLVNLGANNDVIVTSGSITVNNAGGASAVNIQDGGNSITVDGTVAISGTVAVTQSTSPWVVSATDLDIRDLVFATDKVDVSGSTLGANSGVDIGDVTINNAAGAAAVNIQDGGNSITVDGSVSISGTVDTELPAAATLADNTTNPSTTSVGTFNHWYDGATWDRARGDSTDGLLVNLGANNDVTVTSGTITISNLPATVDTNFGTVGASTLRSAAQIGNATGAALFGAGTTTAQVLRVVLPTDQTVIPVSDNGGSLTVDGTVAISGTVAVTQSTSPWVTSTAETLVDNAAFTDGTSKVFPVGFIFDEVAGTALTENDVGASRMDSKRALVHVIEDETTRGRRMTVTAANAAKVDGSAVTQPVSLAAGATSIGKAEDVASADADVGVPAMAIRKATPANTSGSDGDYEMLQMSAGRLWVDASGVTLTVGSHAVTNAGTFAVQATVAAGATNIAKAEDVASADADVGVPAMAIRKATPANTSGTDGDYEMLQISAGRLWTSATIDAALPTGTNTIGAVMSPTGTPSASAAVTVSTSAVSIIASNASRKGVIITNNGRGNLYIGKDNTVTSSGATMGLLLQQGGTFQDDKLIFGTSAIFGIYDVTASAQNVAVVEST